MIGLLAHGYSKSDDFDLTGGRTSLWSLRIKALFHLFTHRISRGGPRLLLQISACVLAILALVRLVPVGLNNGHNFGFLPWSKARLDSRPGGLRIVVFGSQDMAGSSAAGESSWTQRLCKELKCTSMVSMVPPAGSRPGLTSNSIHGNALQELNEQTKDVDLTKTPASNYHFISEQYPVSDTTRDLEQQIRKFIAMPPSPVAPHHTLWVFTFGTWDVWNLAALPRNTGQAAVDSLVTHLFSQIELLYRKSLNPRSIAYSDFWSSLNQTEIDRLSNPQAAGKVDDREVESFRIVVPELMDVTLVPGWQRRPDPPAPHSKAEQMRNADWLTKEWNRKVKEALEAWKAKGRARPADIEAEGFEKAMHIGHQPTMATFWSHWRRGLDEKNAIVYAPFPRRAGLQPSLAAAVVASMTDQEMQQSGATDGQGRSSTSANGKLRFFDVWTPCVADSSTVMLESEPESMNPPTSCKNADEHLFGDLYTVGSRARQELASMTAQQISANLFLS